MRFAYRSEFATEPLADALRGRGWETLELPPAAPNESVGGIALNNSAADIVLTSPLDYARAIGLVDYAMVPAFGITTRSFAGMVRLLFKKGLQSFASIAVEEQREYEELVARIVLAEKHEIEPVIQRFPVGTPIDVMFADADALLLAGDRSIFDVGDYRTLLDLSDEWEDAVEAPLPYMIAWGRIGSVEEGVLRDLVAARESAVLTLADRATQHPQPAEANAFYQQYLRGAITYDLGGEETAALEAFFRYAFYHTAITDIPAVKFL
jgi:predicted solute-binding protein